MQWERYSMGAKFHRSPLKRRTDRLLAGDIIPGLTPHIAKSKEWSSFLRGYQVDGTLLAPSVTVKMQKILALLVQADPKPVSTGKRY